MSDCMLGGVGSDSRGVVQGRLVPHPFGAVRVAGNAGPWIAGT